MVLRKSNFLIIQIWNINIIVKYCYKYYIELSWLDGEEVHNEDEEAMMKMMGFSNFDSTKVITTKLIFML